MFRWLKSKVGQAVTLQNLGMVVLALVVGGLIATYGGDIVSDINADQTANSAARNISGNTLTGILNFTGQLGNVGTVLGAALIITVLIGAFMFFRGRQ